VSLFLKSRTGQFLFLNTSITVLRLSLSAPSNSTLTATGFRSKATPLMGTPAVHSRLTPKTRCREFCGERPNVVSSNVRRVGGGAGFRRESRRIEGKRESVLLCLLFNGHLWQIAIRWGSKVLEHALKLIKIKAVCGWPESLLDRDVKTAKVAL
jgi:hypothetical protein